MVYLRGKPRVLQKGQGLVEYALILVLVAIAVIIIVALVGEEVQDTYCGVVFSLDPNADAPFCEALEVTCAIQTTSPFRMEAIVQDNAGDDNITEVRWYVDGKLHNTEHFYHYCLEDGDGPLCAPYTGPTGQHKFTAVAYDADDNVGRCTVIETVP